MQPRAGLQRATWLVLALAGAWAAPPVPAGEGEGAAREIAALLEAVAASDCEFQRNGRWHPPRAARRHLERKLEQARRLGRDGSAEAFIEQVASRSSLSGRPYSVRCAGGREEPSADWFRRELQRLREADSSRAPR